MLRQHIVVCTGAWLLMAVTARAHPPAAPPTLVDATAEQRIHTPPGFRREGKPQIYFGDDAVRLRATVVDRATGQPTPCRVNVVGADGNYYEPRDNPLANWSLFRAGNRLGKGPFRYYGWFFYTTGEFEVTVPPGLARVEVWKGFEFAPLAESVQALAGRTHDVKLSLERTRPMVAEGYYSGDTHIHLPRRNAIDDERALDLIAAEDIEFGYMLSANDGRSYTGEWQAQPIAPQRTQGAEAIASRGGYTIASGQEYVTASYGHVGMVLHARTLLEGQSVDPNRWPILGAMAGEARKLAGCSFNLHGGNGGEIYLDFAQQATDGVELLQFADYRGIGLEGWYHMLNIGCRFPAVGACDYPFCRVLGDCRTYVHSSERPDAVGWARAAAEGRSFFTTGPLLLLEVDGHRPGDVISRSAGDSPPFKARARVRTLVAPISYVELIVNGQSFARRDIAKNMDQKWFEFEAPVAVDRPLWIAARCGSKSPADRPDALAHTNPVFVAVDGRLPYAEASADWLLKRIDEQIDELEHRQFDERAQALEFYRASQAALLEIRRNRGQPLDSSPQTPTKN